MSNPSREETPEEYAARKAEKRQRKEEKKKRQAAEMFGYTNENNPFGDSNLTQKFVWGKKNEKLQEQGIDPREFSKQQAKARQQELREEIEKVKKRREEREAEHAAWEAEKERIARERDGASIQEWEKKEETFLVKQAHIRAEIRLREGRPHPMDILYRNLSLLDNQKQGLQVDTSFDIDLREPYMIFEGISSAEILEAKEDIRLHIETNDNEEFWRAMMVCCQDALQEALRREEAERQQELLSRQNRFKYQSAPHTVPFGFDGSMPVLATPAPSSGREGGVHNAVKSEVASMFESKTHAELLELEEQMQMMLESDVDTEYWEGALKQLKIAKAKALLREFHAKLLELHLVQLEQRKEEEEQEKRQAEEREQKLAGMDESEREAFYQYESQKKREKEEEQSRTLQMLREEFARLEGDVESLQDLQQQQQQTVAVEDSEEIQLDEADSRSKKRARHEESDEISLGEPAAAAAVPMASGNEEEIDLDGGSAPAVPPKHQNEWEDEDAFEIEQGEGGAYVDDEDEVSRSPILIQDDDLMATAIDPLKDYTDLCYKRHLVLERVKAKQEQALLPIPSRAAASASSVGASSSSHADAESQFLAGERAVPLEAGEAYFTGEVALNSEAYWWNDKYRPRKPKFFNRVHTGFDWNKYNQTHYDHDNPPPKTVRGYKFNIFYPDLIDKTQTPTYFIEPGDSPDTQILRFHAGPPYEDVAFKIVKADWSFNKRHGFRVVFDRGVLQLCFNFKRIRYRR